MPTPATAAATAAGSRMSPIMRSYIAVLVASLIDGVGLQPKAEPRPVVKVSRFAPEATCPVAEHGSRPGLSMNTNPRLVTGLAYSITSLSGEVPALATAPSDFSKMVVNSNHLHRSWHFQREQLCDTIA